MRSTQIGLALAILLMLATTAAAQNVKTAEAITTAERSALTNQAGGRHIWYRTLNGQRGVYHDGKTFVCFHGGGEEDSYLDPFVMSYDHGSGEVAGPVKVGENPLVDYPDFHGNPGMIVDDEGYVHVVYGGHGHYRGRQKHAVSKRPGEIGEWEHVDNIEPESTYPTLFKTADGRIWLFYRDGNHRDDWVYVVSDDHGRTFSEKTRFLSSGERRSDEEYYEKPYVDGWYGLLFQGPGDTIHYVTRYHACADDYGAQYHLDRRVNLYYARFEPGDGWFTLGSKRLTLPLTDERQVPGVRVVGGQGSRRCRGSGDRRPGGRPGGQSVDQLPHGHRAMGAGESPASSCRGRSGRRGVDDSQDRCRRSASPRRGKRSTDHARWPPARER